MVDATPEADKNDPSKAPLPDLNPDDDVDPLPDLNPDDDVDPLPDLNPDDDVDPLPDLDDEPSCRPEPAVPLEPAEISMDNQNDKFVVQPTPKQAAEDAAHNYLKTMHRKIEEALKDNKSEPPRRRLYALIKVLEKPKKHPPAAVHGVRHDHPAVHLGSVLTTLKAALIPRKGPRPDGKEEKWGEWHFARGDTTLKRVKDCAEDYGSRPPPGAPGEPTPEMYWEACYNSAVADIAKGLLRLIGDDELPVPEYPADGMTEATATWPPIPPAASRG